MKIGPGFFVSLKNSHNGTLMRLRIWTQDAHQDHHDQRPHQKAVIIQLVKICYKDAPFLLSSVRLSFPFVIRGDVGRKGNNYITRLDGQ